MSFHADRCQKFGRIAVLPIDDDVAQPNKADEGSEDGFSEEGQPLMLLALNATDAVEWDELQEKVRACIRHRCSRHRDLYPLAGYGHCGTSSKASEPIPGPPQGQTSTPNAIGAVTNACT